MFLILFLILFYTGCLLNFDKKENNTEDDVSTKIYESSNEDTDEFFDSGCPSNRFSTVLPEISDAVLESKNCTSNYMITAPHGSYDTHTEDIVAGVCNKILWDCIIADKYRSKANPINVNRPTEGIGLPWDDEPATPRAETVFNHLKDQFDTIKSETLNLYVEIHGQAGKPNEIHIATVGLESAKGQDIKDLLENNLAYYFSGITVFIEPVDSVYYSATANKEFGMLYYVDNKFNSPALHIELPPQMRINETDYNKTISYLQVVLPKIVKNVIEAYY